MLCKGVLNLMEGNRHAQFFKNLIEASRTSEGCKVIEEYANSDSKNPPDLSKFKEIGKGIAERRIRICIPTRPFQSCRKHGVAVLS